MTICRLFGVRVKLNHFFLLLLLLLAYAQLLREGIALFAIVLFHETAHAVVAKARGLKVSEIELLPFGGVARIDDVIEFDPSVEVAVAMAGPLSNLLLAGGIYLAAPSMGLPADVVQLLIEGNLWIGGFNLIPALPLDGGRVLRAKLAKSMGFRRATETAALIGKGCAVVLGLAGAVLLYMGEASVSLIVVAFFVFLAAGKEEGLAAYVMLRYLARKRMEIEREGCLITHHLTALERTAVKEVIRHFVPTRFHLLWVVDERGRVVALVDESELIDSLFERGLEITVGELGRSL